MSFHIALVAICLCSTLASAATFEYLYVEANEGNSSGGHSALQLGDEIFHYQHLDSGFIRLLKENRQDFHFQYRFLQNRRIHLSQVEVSEDTLRRLRDHFKLQFLAQDQQFKQLHQLQKDRALLRWLLNRQDTVVGTDFASILRLNAVGLFYAEGELDLQQKGEYIGMVNVKPSQSSFLLGMLRRKIEQYYGQNYLSRRSEQITKQIKLLTPSDWPLGQSMLAIDQFPPAIDSFAERYTDHLKGLVAIKVLMEERMLRPDAFLLTLEAVTPEEKEALERLRDQLMLSLVKSIHSRRPDWGYAVLVNIARLAAIDMTLQLDQWVFVDDFGMDSEWISADELAQYAEPMQIQIDDALSNWTQMREVLLNPGDLTEATYSKLEMSANRYFELLKGAWQPAIRIVGEKALPTKSIVVPDWVVPELTQKQLTLALSALNSYEAKFRQELAGYYRYDLITRNCVTELFRTIDRALLPLSQADVDPSKQTKYIMEESIKRLGGHISAAYNFIPFISFQSVQAQYRVMTNDILDSYRDQQLKKLFVQNDRLTVSLRESNTLTSTLYSYHPEDAFFIFFTDGNAVLRPIAGLFNTTAGIGQSVLGFLTWPLDDGKNFKSGATGILMSVPELLFFNIRKGSYKYLSYNQFVKDDAAKY
ncbi:MAG: hypothetical protein ABL863_13685 [Nitrosomonas sp.]